MLTAITFYTNPENIKDYNSYGLYPQNKLVKKILLSDNWKVKFEDDEGFKDIYVPSCYSDYPASKKVTFKTNFFLSGKGATKRHYKLVFYGVNSRCNIKINDNFLENHDSGYNSFYIDINNNILKFNDENTLVVEVDNNLSKSETIPLKIQPNGFKNYGGIFREVFLVVSSQIMINDANVNYKLSEDFKDCQVKISSEIIDYNNIEVKEDDSVSFKTNLAAYVKIYDLFNDKLLKTTKEQAFELERYSRKKIDFEFTLEDPKLWSPKSPYLYRAEVYLKLADSQKEISCFTRNFGVKDFAIKGNDFYLNGEKFLAKGIVRYEDASKMGNAITYKRMNRDIEEIKNLGANLIYSRFTSPHPYLLDLCDKYGLFLIEEMAIISTPSEFLENEKFVELAKNSIKEMIARDKNHPSLLAFGLGSFYNVYDFKAIDFLFEMNDYIKNISPASLTTCCLNLTDFMEYYKICDFNILWLPELKDNLWGKIKKITSLNPSLISNIGQRVDENYNQKNSSLRSEPAQAKAIISKIEKIRTHLKDIGVIINSYNDRYSDIPLLYNSIDQDKYRINEGIVDYYGKKRISYGAVEALYKNGKLPSLGMVETKNNKVHIYFIIGFLLTVVFIYMLNREHYLKLNVFRSFKNPDTFYVDILDKRITQTWQPIFLMIVTSISLASSFSSIAYYLRESLAMDNFLSHFFASGLLKEYITSLVWQPYKFIILFSLVFFAIYFFIVFYIRAWAFFFGVRLNIAISISLIFWNTVALVWLIPFSAVFYRMMSMRVIEIFFVLLIISFIWISYSIIHLMAIAFKLPLYKILAINLALVTLILLSYFYFFGIDYNFMYYMNYLVKVIASNG